MKKRSQILESKKVVAVNESVDERGLRDYLKNEGIYGYDDEIISILEGEPNSVVLAELEEAAKEKGSWLERNYPSVKTVDDIEKKLDTQAMMEAYLNWVGILGYTRHMMAYENQDVNEADDVAKAIERHPKAEEIFNTLEQNPGMTPEEAMRAMEEAQPVEEAKEMDIDTELGIPLIDIVKNIDPKATAAGNTTKSGWELIQDNGAKTEKLVKDMIAKEIKDARANVKVVGVKYLEADSGNISHGTAYWKVILRGTQEELEKVSGDDKLLYWDWTNEDAFGTGKENPGFSEMTNPNVGYDYGDGIGDSHVVNRIPALPAVVELPTFEEAEEGEEAAPINEVDAPQGGFSDAVWRSKPVQNYWMDYGWINSDERTDEMDRWIEDALTKLGWNNEEIGAYIISSAGRYLGDALTFGKEDDRFLRTFRKGHEEVKKLIKKEGLEYFYESDQAMEAKIKSKWLEFHVDAVAANALQKELDSAMWTYEKGVSDRFPSGYLFSIEFIDDEDKEQIFNDFINPIKRKGGKIKQA